MWQSPPWLQELLQVSVSLLWSGISFSNVEVEMFPEQHTTPKEGNKTSFHTHMFTYVYALWWHVTAEMLEPRLNTCIVYNGWSTVCYWSFTPRFAMIICYIKYLQTLHGFYSLQINIGTCKGRLIPMETNYRGTQSKDLWQGQCQIIYTRLKGEEKKSQI